MGAAQPYRILEYLTSEGKGPFREWLDGLDLSVKARIQARILRFEAGNLGDRKPVGAGVYESRLDFGPGYRIYFGIEGSCLVVLLCGGAKGSQTRDIRQAHCFWSDYLKRGKHDKTGARLE